MNIIPLVGLQLKSDEIIELLEIWNAAVVYDFDRLKENVPDAYLVQARDTGVEMHFDANQTLTCVFLHGEASDNFSPFYLLQSDIPSFGTIEDAELFAKKKGVRINKGIASPLGRNRIWIKLGFDTHSIHYEFVGGVISLVTVALRQPDCNPDTT